MEMGVSSYPLMKLGDFFIIYNVMEIIYCNCGTLHSHKAFSTVEVINDYVNIIFLSIFSHEHQEVRVWGNEQQG